MVDDGDPERGPAPVSETRPATSVLVVDDSRLYREGLALWLTGRMEGSAVDTADSLTALARHLDRSLPDVVVLNLASVERPAMLAELTRRAPLAKLIVVGVDETDEPQVLACAEAGAHGYVTRSDSLADLVTVIEQVVAGGTRMSAAISSFMLRRVREAAADRRCPPSVQILTDREIQILRLIGSGLSNQDIADQLTIELHTVKNHVHSLLTKLGVRRRGQAAALLMASEASGRVDGIHTVPAPRMDLPVHARAGEDVPS